MLLNARRITFEPEYRLPAFTFDTLYRIERVKREESLLNNNGQFFVNISEDKPYVKELVRQAQNLNLSVSGDGTAVAKGGDITEARKGDLITVGSSSRFDVNWIKRHQYFCQKGYAPVYDIVKDWNKIEKALKQFADNKRSMRMIDGTEVRFHSRFAVIDGRVVPYDKDQIAILVPTRVLDEIILNLNIDVVRVVRSY